MTDFTPKSQEKTDKPDDNSVILQSVPPSVAVVSERSESSGWLHKADELPICYGSYDRSFFGQCKYCDISLGCARLTQGEE